MIKIYGCSDDLVEIEGDIEDEFCTDRCILDISDGTALLVEYTRSGVWRIAVMQQGTGTLTKVDAPEDDEDNYSDIVTLEGTITPISWVKRRRS